MYVIITDLTISLVLTTFGNKPKKFDFVHQTPFLAGRRARAGHKTIVHYHSHSPTNLKVQSGPEWQNCLPVSGFSHSSQTIHRFILAGGSHMVKAFRSPITTASALYVLLGHYSQTMHGYWYGLLVFIHKQCLRAGMGCWSLSTNSA